MLLTGDRECGRPFVMNDSFNHIVAGELPRSPAPFHAIYALQRTALRVTLPAPRRARRAAVTPASAVAELGIFL